MLTLEQVKLLDSKVESLIEMVRSLTAERDALREDMLKKQAYIEELEGKVSTYEVEQAKIEECVGNTLGQLSAIHNLASHVKVQSSSLFDGEKGERLDDDLEVQASFDSKTENSFFVQTSDDAKNAEGVSERSENVSHVEDDVTDEAEDHQMAIF